MGQRQKNEGEESFFRIQKSLSCGVLTAQVQSVGEDFQILLWGGESPHIGCTVLSIPRPSLRAGGGGSCTSSVLNVTSHKDEALCRPVAEAAAARFQRTVVCAGGFHAEGMTAEQLREVEEAVEKLKDEILEKIKNIEEKRRMLCTNH